MKLEDNYYKFDKGTIEFFNDNKYFSTKEMECHCTKEECKEQKICKDLIDKLDSLRKEYKNPIKVTSGYRCEAHQKELAEGGKETAKNSQHVLGNAADISSKNIEKLYELCDKAFLCVGKAKSFVHLDLRNDRKRRWLYFKE